MANIIIGERARTLFSISKYLPGMNSQYKSYIDTLQQAMLAATYGSNINNCVIVQTLPILTFVNDTLKFSDIELPLIFFCQIHNVSLDIQRFDSQIIITVNLLLPFAVTYS